MFSDQIAERDETYRRDQGAQIGESGKDMHLQPRCSRRESHQIPHAGNERADNQRPSSEGLKPLLRALDFAFGEGQPSAIAVEDVMRGSPTHHVAGRETTNTSDDSHGDRRNEAQDVLKCEVTGENEEPFVGYRQPDDAEDQ